MAVLKAAQANTICGDLIFFFKNGPSFDVMRGELMSPISWQDKSIPHTKLGRILSWPFFPPSSFTLQLRGYELCVLFFFFFPRVTIQAVVAQAQACIQMAPMKACQAGAQRGSSNMQTQL